MTDREGQTCKHPIMHWVAQPGGYYRMYCAYCGKDMEQETWVPGCFEAFPRTKAGRMTVGSVLPTSSQFTDAWGKP